VAAGEGLQLHILAAMIDYHFWQAKMGGLCVRRWPTCRIVATDIFDIGRMRINDRASGASRSALHDDFLSHLETGRNGRNPFLSCPWFWFAERE